MTQSRVVKVEQWQALGVLFLTAIIIAYPLLLEPSLHVVMRADWTYASGFDPHGPFIDQIVWNVWPIEDQASALLALQFGDIQAYDESIAFHAVAELEATPGVEVTSELGYSFRHFYLNGKQFPTNITGYRLALAFALDKNKLCEVVTGGFAHPMDSVIPISNTFWTYENEISSHYYNKDIVNANASLDACQFIDTPDSPHPGWRYFDADRSGNWTIGDMYSDECEIDLIALAGFDPAIQTCLIQIEGMEECGLKGTLWEFDFCMSCTFPEDFNIYCGSTNIPPPGDPTLLYEFFYSKSATNQFFFRYNNSGYDYNVTQMIAAPTKLEAREWAWNCSQLLLQDMPMITCYNEACIHAYRTDVWEGYVNMIGMNRMSYNPWTLRKIHIKTELGGPWGLPPPIQYELALTEGIYSTNCITDYSGYAEKVFSQIYSHLWQLDPYTWKKVPDLAFNWTIEETSASGDIQDGQKFTFHLYSNITWQDGTPLTSEDVAYSLLNIWPFSTIYSYNSPYSADVVEHIYRIDTPDYHRVEIYTNQSGYFDFTRATYPYILPKHIWEPHANFTSWRPDTTEDMTGSGPFRWAYRVPQQWIILERYSNYHLGVEVPPRPIHPQIPWFFLFMFLGIVIIIVQVILLGILLYRKYSKGSRRKNN